LRRRKELRSFILAIENKFPVNEWKVDGVELWPYIRTKIFLIVVYNEVKRINTIEVKKDNFFKKVIVFYRIIKNTLFSYFKKRIFFKKLKEVETIGLSTPSYRANVDGVLISRFIDTLVVKNDLEDSILVFEKKSLGTKQFNERNVLDYQDFLTDYLRLKRLIKRNNDPKFQLEKYEEFILYIKTQKDFDLKIVSEVLKLDTFKFWCKTFLLPRVKFFKDVFLKTKVKSVWVCCYYGEDYLAAMVAANQLKVQTIELQHGVQNDLHLAYGSWHNMPAQGFLMLPKMFWNWTKEGSDTILSWAVQKVGYSSKIIGNPWIDFWKGKKTSFHHKNFILYSLQTGFAEISNLFPQRIIDVIKNGDTMWFLRLHPGQLSEMNDLIRKVD